VITMFTLLEERWADSMTWCLIATTDG